MKKIKENKAITLVALIITIIILLILAGITISQLANNGLFDKTKTAKEKYENAQDDEEDKIAKYENEINSYVNSNRDISEERIREIFREELDKKSISNVSSTGIDIAKSTTGTTLTQSGWLYMTYTLNDIDSCTVYINDIPVCWVMTVNGGAGYGSGSGLGVFVKNGDVVKYSGSAPKILKLYPYKD